MPISEVAIQFCSQRQKQDWITHLALYIITLQMETILLKVKGMGVKGLILVLKTEFEVQFEFSQNRCTNQTYMLSGWDKKDGVWNLIAGWKHKPVFIIIKD